MKILFAEPSSVPQSSHQTDSRISSDIAMTKTEDNTLYNEQVEFIAQMAENMMQKLTEKREKQSRCAEELAKLNPEIVTKELLGKILTSDESAPGPSGKSNNTLDTKILADNWSSDEEVVASDKLGEGFSKAATTKLSKGNLNEIEDTPSPSKTSEKIIDCDLNDSNDTESSFEEPDLGRESKEKSLIASTIAKETQILNETKKTVEIVICPNQNTDEDIFADVFQSNHVKVGQKSDHTMAGTKSEEKKKKIEIVIDPEYKPDENDIFADIFQTPVKTAKVEKVDPADYTSPTSKDKELASAGKNKEAHVQDLIVDAHINKTVEVKEEPIDDSMEEDFYQNELVDRESDESSISNDVPATNSSCAISSTVLKPPSSSELNEMEVRSLFS